MLKSSFCQLDPPILLAGIHQLSFTTSNPKKIEHFEGNDRENIIELPSWNYLSRSFFRAYEIPICSMVLEYARQHLPLPKITQSCKFFVYQHHGSH